MQQKGGVDAMAQMSKGKQWTVMVYLAGDNNLDTAGVGDLEEMKKVGSTKDVNVIAQFDRQGSRLKTNRYYLRKGESLENDKVASLGETNTGDPKVLEGFIECGAEKYPAQHYLLVVWNHGAGWDDTNIYREARRTLALNITRKKSVLEKSLGAARKAVKLSQIRAISRRGFRRALFRTPIEKALVARAIAFDDNAQDFLDNIEMKKLLSSAKKTFGRKIDIVGMDACLMSMAEVLYQMRDSVEFAVGSEEVEPGDGWPYDTILAELARKPTVSPRQLVAVIVEKYLASYSAGDSVTQSACDLSKSEAMAAAIDKLAKALIDNLSSETVRMTILNARNQVQSYEVSDYVDLVDFCDLVKSSTSQAPIPSACQAARDAAIAKGFVIKSGYKGAPMGHSSGLSIYFPTREISPLYANLDFVNKTAWGKFLQEYVESTSRRL